MEDRMQIENNLGRLKECFVSELSLLKGICSSPKLQGKPNEVRIVLASACTTGTAIYELGGKPQYFYSELIMLGRAFIEKVTNYCYLQICEEDEFQRFLLYPYYRASHDTLRTKHAGEQQVTMQYTGRDDIKTQPKFAEALNAFSETNPRKKWSTRSIDEKVAVIKATTDLSIEFFLLNTLNIYSDASEALHGTLFGCALPTGAFSFGVESGNVLQVEMHVIQNTALLFAQLASMIHETIRLLARNNQFVPFLEASSDNRKVVLEHLKCIFQNSA